MRSLKLVAGLVIVALVGTLLAVISASPSAATTADITRGDADMVDHDLVFALDLADLWDDWRATSQTSGWGAVVAVEGDAYTSERETFVLAAIELAFRRHDRQRLLADLDELAGSVGFIDQAARTMRSTEARGLVLSPVEVSQLIKDLQVAGSRREVTPTVSQLRASVLDLRTEVIERLADHPTPRAAAKRVAIAAWRPTLDRVDTLSAEIDRRRASALFPSEAEQLAIARVDELMGALARSRATALTPQALPLVTLDAYVLAERFVPAGCRTVDWALLAGIGRVESLHGTLGGALVDAAGVARPSIFGPLLDGGETERQIEAARIAAELAELQAIEEAIAAEEAEDRMWAELVWGPEPADEASTDALPPAEAADADDDSSDGDDDGEEDTDERDLGNGFAVVADTDRGALDRNASWDRAVGPMQFLPGTWRLWGTDGDDDGVADPHDIHDATASAARYLCHLEARNGPDPSLYVLGYNDSASYVSAVLEWADRYRALAPHLSGVSE